MDEDALFYKENFLDEMCRSELIDRCLELYTENKKMKKKILDYDQIIIKFPEMDKRPLCGHSKINSIRCNDFSENKCLRVKDCHFKIL